MSEKLIRRDFTFRSEMVYEVKHPRLSHPYFYEIIPTMVKIIFTREAELSAWEVDWVSITGTRILKSGKPGTSTAQHTYSRIGLGEDKDAPRWLHKLVSAALADVESIRTAM